VGTLFFNRDYGPCARNRDEKIRLFQKGKGVQVRAFKDQVIFEPGEILKTEGEPSVVYTPYMRRWRERLTETETGYYLPKSAWTGWRSTGRQGCLLSVKWGMRMRKGNFPPANPENRSSGSFIFIGITLAGRLSAASGSISGSVR